MPSSAGRCDGGGEALLGGCPVPERLTHLVKGARVGNLTSLGLMILEPGREFIGLLKDFFNASGHSNHLRYLARAGMAWTITGPFSESTTPIS